MYTLPKPSSRGAYARDPFNCLGEHWLGFIIIMQKYYDGTIYIIDIYIIDTVVIVSDFWGTSISLHAIFLKLSCPYAPLERSYFWIVTNIHASIPWLDFTFSYIRLCLCSKSYICIEWALAFIVPFKGSRSHLQSALNNLKFDTNK